MVLIFPTLPTEPTSHYLHAVNYRAEQKRSSIATTTGIGATNTACRNAEQFNNTIEVVAFMVHDDRVASGRADEASN